MSKIAFFTDLHLGVHQNSEKWLEISIKWAKWFVNELSKKNIDTIVFGGDFFHYRDEVSVKTIHYANLILDIFKDFNIIMITGNHDCYYKNTSQINSLSILNYKHRITIIDEPKLVEIYNKKLMMCPWGTSIDDIQNADIVFGHFEIQNFKYNQFKVCDHGFKPKEVLKKSNLIFSGHFHKREEREYSNGYIVYAGNPFEMDFSDFGDTKGYYIIDLDTNKFEFFNNTVSPRHIKFRTSEYKFISKYQDKINRCIIKLIVDNDVTMKELDRIIAKINSFNPVDLTVDYLQRMTSNSNINMDNNSLIDVNIRDYIIEFIESAIDQNYSKDVVDRTLDIYKKFV